MIDLNTLKFMCISMVSENKVRRDLELLIDLITGYPDWYGALTEENKKKVRPILEEITKAVKKYYLELRPKSKEEGLNYIERSLKEIDKRISSIENGKLQELLVEHSKSVMGTILEYRNKQ